MGAVLKVVLGVTFLAGPELLWADPIADRISLLETMVSRSCEGNNFACDPVELVYAKELRDLRTRLRVQTYNDVSTRSGLAPFSLMATCEGFRAEGIARETQCATEWGQWFKEQMAAEEGDLRAAVVSAFSEEEADRLGARSDELGWLYWPDMMLDAALPEATQPQAEEIVIQAGPDGHFRVQPELDGVSVEMMVDTGASVVLLTAEDAAKVGIDPEQLSFDAPVMTAAGEAWFAESEVRNLQLFDLHLQDVRVLVAPSDYSGSTSLLGMSVLREFASVNVQGSTLQLR